MFYTLRVRMKKVSIIIIMLTYIILAFPIAIAMGIWETADELNDFISRWIKR